MGAETTQNPELLRHPFELVYVIMSVSTYLISLLKGTTTANCVVPNGSHLLSVAI